MVNVTTMIHGVKDVQVKPQKVIRPLYGPVYRTQHIDIDLENGTRVEMTLFFEGEK